MSMACCLTNGLSGLRLLLLCPSSLPRSYQVHLDSDLAHLDTFPAAPDGLTDLI